MNEYGMHTDAIERMIEWEQEQNRERMEWEEFHKTIEEVTATEEFAEFMRWATEN